MSGVAVEESRAGVCLRKKTLSPGHRRDLAQRAVAAQLCSGRSACRILRLARSTYWYRGQPLSSRQAQLRQRLRELSEQHPRYGYRRITALLRQAGWAVGKRQIAITAGRRAAGAANEAQGCAAGSLDGLAGEGGSSWTSLSSESVVS